MLTNNEILVIEYLKNHPESITVNDIAKAIDLHPAIVNATIDKFISKYDPPLAQKIPAEIELQHTNKVIHIIRLTEDGKIFAETYKEG